MKQRLKGRRHVPLLILKSTSSKQWPKLVSKLCIFFLQNKYEQLAESRCTMDFQFKMKLITTDASIYYKKKRSITFWSSFIHKWNPKIFSPRSSHFLHLQSELEIRENANLRPSSNILASTSPNKSTISKFPAQFPIFRPIAEGRGWKQTNIENIQSATQEYSHRPSEDPRESSWIP